MTLLHSKSNPSKIHDLFVTAGELYKFTDCFRDGEQFMWLLVQSESTTTNAFR